jgi:DNA invertase Pin-like site-specific DNA recombinase
MEAQRECVSRYVRGRGLILAEYVEVESGRKADRPQLNAALEECRRARAVLLIARLDRLARNVAFIANLMNSDVEFVAVDMPTANRLTIHILAAVAEHERELISQRTKAALAAAKARGTRLGNPRFKEALEKARAAIAYARPAGEILQLMSEWRNQGAVLTDIAERMNSLRIPTPKGYTWYASTVRAALARLPEFTKARDDESTTARNNEFALSSITSGLNGFDSQAIPAFVTANAGRTVTTAGDLTMADLAEAFRMLDTFASVGATHFDVTFLDIDGQKCGFRKEQTARQLRNSLPHLLPGLTERRQSLIVRPYGDGVRFVQLDDLKDEQLKQLSPVSCLILETSPANHQSWVAIPTDSVSTEPRHTTDSEKDFARRLRKGVGADLSASGATRIAGAGNYKRKYEPDFPEVKILQAAPGRQTTRAQLEVLGLLAAPEPEIRRTSTVYQPKPMFGRIWPSYQKCLAGAPMRKDGKGPDRSLADYTWAKFAAQRGFSIDEIAAELPNVSDRARERVQGRDPGYVTVTAKNGFEAAERGKQRSRA